MLATDVKAGWQRKNPRYKEIEEHYLSIWNTEVTIIIELFRIHDVDTYMYTNCGCYIVNALLCFSIYWCNALKSWGGDTDVMWLLCAILRYT